MPDIRYSFPTCRATICRTPSEPGYADRGLCLFHEKAGEEAISRLVEDWSGLQPLIWDKAKGGNDEIIASVFGPTMPIDLAADALAREIVYVAVVWEIAIRERARLSDAPNQSGMGTIDDLQRACKLLLAHYSALIALGPTTYLDYDRKIAEADGIDATLHLTDLHRRAHGRVGIRLAVTSVPGGCGECGRETLRHRNAASVVFCGTCKTEWSWDVYQDSVFDIPTVNAA